jgi:hypothetical protein
MSSKPRVPSVEQIKTLAESGARLRGLVVRASSTLNYIVWIDESALADAFAAFADALRPLRKLTEESVTGWADDYQVWMAVRDMPGEMDTIARRLKMERLTDPPEEREAFIAAQDARWRKRVAAPFFDAALSIQRGCRIGETSAEINYWAKLARDDGGYHATMTLEKARDKYPKARDRFWTSPRLGADLPAGNDAKSSAKRAKLNVLPVRLSAAVQFLERELAIARRSDESEKEKIKPGPKAKTRGGRPVVHDPKADRRVFDAWKSGQYEDFERLATALGTAKREVQLAIGRHRAREGRKGK